MLQQASDARSVQDRVHQTARRLRIADQMYFARCCPHVLSE